MAKPNKQENEVLHRLTDLIVTFTYARVLCRTDLERKTLAALEGMARKELAVVEKQIASRKPKKRNRS
jgi:hypothetical protein